jgi:hypothetical protein
MPKTKKIWFKAKTYGWGWGAPASWEGWVVFLIFIAFNVKVFWLIDSASHSGSDTLMNFILPFVLSIVILFIICYLKGEKLGWRWGNKKF